MRVDRVTMVCLAHQCHGCIVCMTDDFHDWVDARKDARRAYKKAWRETPVHERFDLGGEG